jgi:hypothetical protein
MNVRVEMIKRLARVEPDRHVVHPTRIRYG